METAQGIEKPFRKLLVANRGEIACRILRTAQRMGLKTVAVFSDADRQSLHVSMADEAVNIGAPPARNSYLDIDRIIAAALDTGAEAIHPGYGFLSENDAFADACRRAGVIFVGPSAEAIRAMASKASAKTLMQNTAVPIVPGYHGTDQSSAILEAEARRIGFPVFVKASAGGGGRGMRLAESPDALGTAIESAKREALAAFGDDHVMIEKYIANPRHIEVQIFGDTHGNIVSLFERECTLQRRHQKVVEEAPSTALSSQARERIYAAARVAAAAVGYCGAGTVEFVADDSGFYFIEMNTRLQVEHPVTEMITGLDLVEWQLRVAAGEPLPLRQEDITLFGHAIEARIFAENPTSGFLPSIGTISTWRQPVETPRVRIDSGFREGDRITPHYDSMLAKLIVHGPDRETALDVLHGALAEMQVSGVKTNLAFLQSLVDHPAVRSGTLDTGFIERELAVLLQPSRTLSHGDKAAAVAAVLQRERQDLPPSPFDIADGWTLVAERRRTLTFTHADDDAPVTVDLIYGRKGLRITSGEAQTPFSFESRNDMRLDVFYGDRKETVSAIWTGESIEITTLRGRHSLTLVDPFRGEESRERDAGTLRSPMPGTIQQVCASPGARLTRGTPILILEAMKMEYTLRAPADGVLNTIRCKAGDVVPENMELAEFTEDESG